jgi:type I restriction enzyme, S subunit
VWYVIQRGTITRRIDAYSNQPHFRRLFEKIHNTGHRIATFKEVSEGCIFSGTTPLAKGNAYVEPPLGVRFVRSGEITSEGNITAESAVHISTFIHDGTMKSSQLKRGDLLIAIVGATIGSVGIYDDDKPANINQAIAVARLYDKGIYREFACWYLQSNLGQRLLDFFKRPVARANINLEEIGDIPLIIPSLKKQEEILSVMDKVKAERRKKLAEADTLLSGLDDYLINILGLKCPVKDERKIFAVRHKAISTRFDPNFHLPAFAQSLRMLTMNKSMPLGMVTKFSDEMRRPEKKEEPTFRYIEISNVNIVTGEAQAIETLVAEAPSRARMAVHTGDIIVSLTRPHYGAIAQITTELDGCIASTGFAVIRGVDESKISIDYLWCILRTKICLSQMLQRASGGNYPAITESELAKVLIFVPDKAIQTVIVAEVHRRRNKARYLRANAESGWQAAKHWFEEQLLGPIQP